MPPGPRVREAGLFTMPPKSGRSVYFFGCEILLVSLLLRRSLVVDDCRALIFGLDLLAQTQSSS